MCKLFQQGLLAEWLGSGLQNHLRRFESARDLHLSTTSVVLFYTPSQNGLGVMLYAKQECGNQTLWHTICPEIEKFNPFHMKSIFKILVFSFFLLNLGNDVYAQRKNKKKCRQEQFAEIQNLVTRKQFIFVANRAFPQGGHSIDLTSNYGFVAVKGKESTGDLPFFGRAYSAPYGGGGGIEFEKTEIRKEKLNINKGTRKISYCFEARGIDDTYSIKMDIECNGNASLSVSCNKRSTISYMGKVSEIEEDEENE